MKRYFSVTLVAVATGAAVHANDARAQAVLPCSHISRTNVVRCALAASLAAKAEREALQAADGKRLAARPLLPANPVLSLSAGRRLGRGTQPATFDWDARLAQELEIGGQRGARQRAAQAETQAQQQNVVATDREVAAQAMTLYFEVLAADEELRLARLLEGMASRVADAAAAAASKGVIAGVDADVAEAAMLRLARQRIEADRRTRQARTELLTLLGNEPSGELKIDGELEPLANVEPLAATLGARARNERPEVAALQAQGRAFHARADLFRRTRVPNPTLSVFAQNDAFDEKIVGIGVAMPIPMPDSFGHTYAGEIDEAEALSLRAETLADRTRRELRGQLRAAVEAYELAKDQRALFTKQRTERATLGLQSIAAEIEAGRLGIRDAIVTEQALIEVLVTSVDAKRTLCLASVELARAAGAPIERGAP